jgi:hypothetical protein
MKSNNSHSSSKIRNPFLGFGWNTGMYSNRTKSNSIQIKTNIQNLHHK